MKRFGLRSAISIQFALIVLVVITLISILSNVLINQQFKIYMKQQHAQKAQELAQNLSNQYNNVTGEWNIDYIHGLGMYALDEGYILKVYNIKKEVLWDAESHDMTSCHQMMTSISDRMASLDSSFDGDFVKSLFEMKQGDTVVGYLHVSYYSPYYLNENDFNFITALNKILIGVGITSLIGAVLMGIILSGSIAKPIRKTVEITKQISNGDYGIRFKGGVKTIELKELTQAVNHMADSLEQLETLRKRLTSDVAHELRTPIANVSSYLEAIIEGVWEPTQERLQNCYYELERISKLVTDLERLRQTESDNLKLSRTEVDLFTLSKAVVSNFEPQLNGKQISCNVDGTSAKASADYDKMKQVITNLVSNAIKYSNEGGTIHIEISEQSNNVIISISDDGIGIPKEEQKMIFERFYRTDKSRNRKTGGAGIGLTIVKMIVQAHGGKIIVESDEGNGSRFTITLPK